MEYEEFITIFSQDSGKAEGEINKLPPEETAKQAIPDEQKKSLLQKLENAANRISITISRYDSLKKEVEEGLSKSYYSCCIDALCEYKDAIEGEQGMAKDTNQKIDELKEKISSQTDYSKIEADAETSLFMVQDAEELYRDIRKNFKLNRFEIEEEGDWLSNLFNTPTQRHHARNCVINSLNNFGWKDHVLPYDIKNN